MCLYACMSYLLDTFVFYAYCVPMTDAHADAKYTISSCYALLMPMHKLQSYCTYPVCSGASSIHAFSPVCFCSIMLPDCLNAFLRLYIVPVFSYSCLTASVMEEPVFSGPRDQSLALPPLCSPLMHTVSASHLYICLPDGI
jgi:hypothetical protein